MTIEIKTKPYSEPLELQEAWRELYIATNKYTVFLIGETEGGGMYKTLSYNPHLKLFNAKVVHNGFYGIRKKTKADEIFRTMEDALEFYNDNK